MNHGRSKPRDGDSHVGVFGKGDHRLMRKESPSEAFEEADGAWPSGSPAFVLDLT